MPRKNNAPGISLHLIGIILIIIGLTGCSITINGLDLFSEEPPPEYTEEGIHPEQHDEDESPDREGGIITFTADRTHIQPGECVSLQWETAGGFGVFLNGREVDRSGQLDKCLDETTPFVLELDLGEAMDFRELAVRVGNDEEEFAEEPPPEEFIPEENMAEELGEEEEPPPSEEDMSEGEPPEISFTAEQTGLHAGECTALQWQVEGEYEMRVFLNGEPVEPFGEREVCPSEPTFYWLDVEAGHFADGRELVIHVSDGEPMPDEESLPQEPPPAEEPPPQASPPPEPPTPTPAPQPQPSQPVVIDFWVDNNNIKAGDCTTLRWHVANANAVHLDGAGVVGDDTKQICPTSTSVYVLHVAYDGGADEKKVTVKVSGGSPPQPQSADLAVTDLFADKLVQGKVYARLTNHGPGNLTNVTVQLSCSGAGWANNSPTPVSNSKSVSVTLSPGQTQQFNTGIVIDTNQYSYYELTCEVQHQDGNSSNNSYGETIP